MAWVYLILKGEQSLALFMPKWKHRGENMLQRAPLSNSAKCIMTKDSLISQASHSKTGSRTAPPTWPRPAKSQPLPVLVKATIHPLAQLLSRKSSPTAPHALEPLTHARCHPSSPTVFRSQRPEADLPPPSPKETAILAYTPPLRSPPAH